MPAAHEQKPVEFITVCSEAMHVVQDSLLVQVAQEVWHVSHRRELFSKYFGAHGQLVEERALFKVVLHVVHVAEAPEHVRQE